MANKRIKASSIILKIVFDIEIDGELFKDITLDYTPEENEGFELHLVDIHYEDNDSWNMFKAGDTTYDCQFYGEDDTLAYIENNVGDMVCSTKLAMKIPIHHQINVMYEEDGYLNHSDVWLTDDECKMSNVKIYTNDGIITL